MESEIKLVTGLHYLLLEFTSKRTCVTAPHCKALPVNGKFVPVNGIKPYRGAEVQVHSSLTPRLKGIEWHDSCLGNFTPVDSPPTHCIGGLIYLASPRAGLDVRLSFTCQNQTSTPLP
jgi:hypothetical protein